MTKNYRKAARGLAALSFFLILLSAAGCRRGQDSGELPMTFSAGQQSATEVKSGAGAYKTDSETDLQSQPFGVYGVYSTIEGSASASLVFESTAPKKVEYSGSGSSTGWTYEPVQYWKRNRYYRFRAYHPYDADVLFSASNADEITIDYRIAEHQYDLLVAFAQRHSVGTVTPVELQFEHVLSALRFKICYNDGIPAEQTDKIETFHITGISPAGTMVYTHQKLPTADYLTSFWTWTPSSYDGSSAYYEWNGSKEFGVYYPDTDTGVKPVDIFDGEGIVFAVPQTCSASASRPTTVHFTTERGGAAVDHSATLPKLAWESGKIYTYTLHVSKTDVSVKVTIKDWELIDSVVDVYL